MQNVIQNLLQPYLKAAWRRRWLGMAAAWLVCCLGWFWVFTIHNQFESSARLYVDADAVLTPLLRGLAVDTGPSSQLEMLQRTLLSRPNLEKLISKTDLDLSIRSPSDRERLITSLGNEIKVIPQTRNLFTIAYRGPDPNQAHDIVQTLLTIFVENATGGNRSDMDNARAFLAHQIASYEEQLRAAEKRRADFRAKYAEMLPGDGAGDLGALETSRQALQSVENQLTDAKVRRDTLNKELAGTPTMLVTDAGGGYVVGPNGTMHPAQTRLKEAEEQLRLLRLRFTDQYPDVIAQQKLIESLRTSPEAAGAPAAASGGTGGASPQRSISNPVYEQLKIRLIDADGLLASLTRQRDGAASAVARLEKVQHDQPGLIAEYQNMDRDYGVLRHNYEELLGRLQAANIAQAADTQADKVKLQVIDPPAVARQPVAPNRLLLLTVVLVAGLGAGVGVPVLLGQLETTFSTVEDLRRLGLPVLGGISLASRRPLRQRFLAAARFGMGASVLAAVYGGLIVRQLHAAALI